MDTKFCFPLQVRLADYRWGLMPIILLYSITILIMIQLLSGPGLALILSILLFVLVYTVFNQTKQKYWAALYATEPDCWSLVDNKGVNHAAKFCDLTIIGNIAVFSLRTDRRIFSVVAMGGHQFTGQWHRLRVFSLNSNS